MREIFFRGKRVDNGEWVEGYYFKAKRHWNGIGVHEDWIADGAIQNGGWCNVVSKHAVVPETVGQYTGLTDKNGKRIFEGDIVKVTTIDEHSVNVSKIGIGICEETLSDVLSMGVYCIVDRTAVVFPCNDEYKSLCEVIGNIHDNRLEDFENGC